MTLPLADFVPVWGLLAMNITSPGPNVLIVTGDHSISIPVTVVDGTAATGGTGVNHARRMAERFNALAPSAVRALISPLKLRS